MASHLGTTIQIASSLQKIVTQKRNSKIDMHFKENIKWDTVHRPLTPPFMCTSLFSSVSSHTQNFQTFSFVICTRNTLPPTQDCWSLPFTSLYFPHRYGIHRHNLHVMLLPEHSVYLLTLLCWLFSFVEDREIMRQYV